MACGTVSLWENPLRDGQVRLTQMRRDGNIRYFEYENDKFEFLSEYKSGDPQRGIAFLPKRGVNVSRSWILLMPVRLVLTEYPAPRERGYARVQDRQRLLH